MLLNDIEGVAANETSWPDIGNCVSDQVPPTGKFRGGGRGRGGRGRGGHPYSRGGH